MASASYKRALVVPGPGENSVMALRSQRIIPPFLKLNHDPYPWQKNLSPERGQQASPNVHASFLSVPQLGTRTPLEAAV